MEKKKPTERQGKLVHSQKTIHIKPARDDSQTCKREKCSPKGHQKGRLAQEADNPSLCQFSWHRTQYLLKFRMTGSGKCGSKYSRNRWCARSAMISSKICSVPFLPLRVALSRPFFRFAWPYLIFIHTSDVLEHKWRASLKTILFFYE